MERRVPACLPEIDVSPSALRDAAALLRHEGGRVGTLGDCGLPPAADAGDISARLILDALLRETSEGLREIGSEMGVVASKLAQTADVYVSTDRGALGRPR